MALVLRHKTGHRTRLPGRVDGTNQRQKDLPLLNDWRQPEPGSTGTVHGHRPHRRHEALGARSKPFLIQAEFSIQHGDDGIPATYRGEAPPYGGHDGLDRAEHHVDFGHWVRGANAHRTSISVQAINQDDAACGAPDGGDAAAPCRLCWDGPAAGWLGTGISICKKQLGQLSPRRSPGLRHVDCARSRPKPQVGGPAGHRTSYSSNGASCPLG